MTDLERSHAELRAVILDELEINMEVDISNPTPQQGFLPRLPTVQTVLEVSSKFFIAAAAILYAIGVLVVSSHLSRYGSFSVSLFRVTYVFAGIWAAIPPILCAVAFSFGKVLANQFANQHLQSDTSILRRLFGKDLASLLSPAVTGVAMLWYSVVSLLSLVALIFLVGVFFPFSPSIVWLWVFVGAAYLVLQFRHIVPDVELRDAHGRVLDRENIKLLGEEAVRIAEEHRKSLPSVTSFTVSFFLTFAVLYMVGFGRFAYGEIPAVLGGGGAQSVRIVLQPEAAQTLGLRGMGADSKPEWTDAQLVAETEQEFLLAIGQNTIRLRRDLVRVMMLKSVSAEGKAKAGGK